MLKNVFNVPVYIYFTAAVNSVLPAAELSTLVSNNQKIKVAFINEISSIAAGIRLHAWYSNKAGKFMFDGECIQKLISLFILGI